MNRLCAIAEATLFLQLLGSEARDLREGAMNSEVSTWSWNIRVICE
jgi:hypothetical protein